MYPYGDTRISPPPLHDDGDERAARWTLWFLAVAVSVVVLGATLIVSLLALRDEAPASTATLPTVVETVTTLPAPAEIGPRAGTDLAAYVAGRKAALAGAADSRVAVISLAKYSTAADAKALIGSAPVVALLVAPPGTSPAVVTGDLAAWTTAQTAVDTAERDEIRKLIPTVTDAAFKAFYTSEVTRLDKAIRGYAPTSALVFGLVIRADGPALKALGARPEVRLVDVAESGDPGPKAVYRGLRPEEVTKANDPSMRPV